MDVSRWWQLKYFWNFHPEKWGRWFSFLTCAYFSNGFKPNHQPGLVLDGCHAFLECRTLSTLDAGDHSLIYAEVKSGNWVVVWKSVLIFIPIFVSGVDSMIQCDKNTYFSNGVGGLFNHQRTRKGFGWEGEDRYSICAWSIQARRIGFQGAALGFMGISRAVFRQQKWSTLVI